MGAKIRELEGAAFGLDKAGRGGLGRWGVPLSGAARLNASLLKVADVVAGSFSGGRR